MPVSSEIQEYRILYGRNMKAGEIYDRDTSVRVIGEAPPGITINAKGHVIFDTADEKRLGVIPPHAVVRSELGDIKAHSACGDASLIALRGDVSVQQIDDAVAIEAATINGEIYDLSSPRYRPVVASTLTNSEEPYIYPWPVRFLGNLPERVDIRCDARAQVEGNVTPGSSIACRQGDLDIHGKVERFGTAEAKREGAEYATTWNRRAS